MTLASLSVCSFFLFNLHASHFTPDQFIKNPNPFWHRQPLNQENFRPLYHIMDCLGQRSLSVSLQAWRFRKRRAWSHMDRRVVVERKKRPIGAVRPVHGVPSRATTSGEVVRTKEFADEEDLIKGGGSEIFYVEMQEMKQMERQSKLADKLVPISSKEQVLDLVVIGCGPAGLSLAAESAKKGLNVGLIGPDLPFTNNYGVWEDEFKDLGLESCIEHVWKDTIVYLDSDKPIFIGRAYGRVHRDFLHEELVKRCYESGVKYLNSRVEKIVESNNGCSLVVCEEENEIPCRLATVASGAASGRLLQYEVGGPRVSVQTAYGVEVEVENNPYDPNLMVFMDYRDHEKKKDQFSFNEAGNPTFLYAMPMSSTRVFFEETCLASRDAMPFDLLKKKLMSRLDSMGIRVLKVYEEEWSYIPVGGSLPNTDQKNLAFGAAASMVHPATGYSVVRSLSEAPKYASVLASILKKDSDFRHNLALQNTPIPSMLAWKALWPQERKRQRAFFLFGLALITQLDIEGIRSFFLTFFRLPTWMWWGFLGSSLSSVDLIMFAFYMFAIAPNSMRMRLVKHLISDPTGATMIKTYLTF